MSAAAQHISPLCVCVCVEFILCTFGTSLKSIKEREATQKSKQKSVSCSEGRLSATAAASARCCCCYTLPWPVARTFQPQIATGIDKAMAKQQQQKSSNNNKLHLVAPHEKAAGNTQNSRTHTHTQSETIYKGLCTVPFPRPSPRLQPPPLRLQA